MKVQCPFNQIPKSHPFEAFIMNAIPDLFISRA
jgi:hypothetical protein